MCATKFSSQTDASNLKNRGSRQPCITKRFVSISTRLIKGDTVRLIFLTCITMMTTKKMQYLKATSTTSFFSDGRMWVAWKYHIVDFSMERKRIIREGTSSWQNDMNMQLQTHFHANDWMINTKNTMFQLT